MTTEAKNEMIAGYVRDAQGSKHPLTYEDAASLLSDAFDSGLLNSWCGGYVVAPDYVRPIDSDTDEYLAVLNGSYINVLEVCWPDGFNAVVEGRHKLNADNLIKGIELYVRLTPSKNIVIGAEYWMDDVRDAADDVIQYALFNQLVFC